MASFCSVLRRAEMCYPSNTATIYRVCRRCNHAVSISCPSAPRTLFVCACLRELVLTHDVVYVQDRSMSWKEFAHGVRALTHALRTIGVCRGLRMAMIARNSDWMLQYMYAAAHLGAVFVPLNVRWSPQELAHAIYDSEASVLVISFCTAGMFINSRYIRDLCKCLYIKIRLVSCAKLTLQWTAGLRL